MFSPSLRGFEYFMKNKKFKSHGNKQKQFYSILKYEFQCVKGFNNIHGTYAWVIKWCGNLKEGRRDWERWDQVPDIY